MKTRQGVYVDSRERLCKWCDAPFRTVKPSETYCGDPCRRLAGLKVRNPLSLSSERQKFVEIMATCPVEHCRVPGPKARLAEHVLWDHALNPDVVLA